MQSDFNQHGAESFRFEVVAEVRDPGSLRTRHQRYIDHFEARAKCYNVMAATTRISTRRNRKVTAAFEIASDVPTADIIRTRRQALGMSQKEVAKAIGLASGEAIGMIETRKRRIDLQHLAALAAVLELDTAAFIEHVLTEYFPSMMEAYRSAKSL